MIIGHCKGHDTIIRIALIDGFEERTIILCSKEVCWW